MCGARQNLHMTTTMRMMKPASRQSVTLAREDSIASDTLLLLGWEAFTSNDADTNLQDENVDGKILKQGRGRRYSEML